MGFPLPVAALGPDYGVGSSYYPVWHPTELDPGGFEVIPANYGIIGSQTRWAGQGGRFGRTAKVYPISWDPGVNPGFDPRIAPWNNLPRGTIYNAKIPSVKRHANYGASITRYNIPKTVRYQPPPMASLMEVS